MDHSPHHIHSLFELLGDENDQSASLVMAELLQCSSPYLNECLRRYQDSDNLRLRRRIHQLEAVLRKRSVRRWFKEEMSKDAPDLLKALIQLHLCWFDNDVADHVTEDWNLLKADFRNDHPCSFAEIAAFMKKQKFKSAPYDELKADYFCLGSVLEDHNGSDLILAVICMMLAQDLPCRFAVFRCGMEFGVMECGSGNLLFPSDGWCIYAGTDGADQPVVWSAREILRFTANMLFFSAVASDGFRYMYTVAVPLASSLGKNDLEFLPYPYGSLKKVSVFPPEKK